MVMYLVDSRPVFGDIRTIAPDGTPRETYKSLILGPTIVDYGWKSQSQWQEFFLRKGQELPSLPALIATFVQIKEAVEGSDALLRRAAEDIMHSIIQNYKYSSLPTSTRINYRDKKVFHRVGTPYAYQIPSLAHELPFELHLNPAERGIRTGYGISELIKSPYYHHKLIALFGHPDTEVVYQALRYILGEEPFLLVHEDDTHLAHDFIEGEAEITTSISVRKVHRTARGVILQAQQERAEQSQLLESLVR